MMDYSETDRNNKFRYCQHGRLRSEMCNRVAKPAVPCSQRRVTGAGHFSSGLRFRNLTPMTNIFEDNSFAKTSIRSDFASRPWVRIRIRISGTSIAKRPHVFGKPDFPPVDCGIARDEVQ